MTTRRTAEREQAAEARAGLRLALAVLGAALLAVVLGPVALLVHDRWAPLLRTDTAISGAAERLVTDHPQVAAAANLLTHLGDPVGVTVATGVGALLLAWSGRRRTALFLVVSRVGALVLSQGTKAAVERVRPRFEDPVASAFGASFPSGHALGSTAFYAALALALLPLVARPVRRALLAAALVVPLLVSATRVLIGVHYLSDVAAGFVLGLGWTAVCAAVFALWRADEGRPVDPLDEGLEPEPEPERT